MQNNQPITAHKDLDRYDDYVCPSCKKELIHKSGGSNKPHFSHQIHEGCKHKDVIVRPQNKEVIDTNLKPEARALILKGLEIMLDGFFTLIEQNKELKNDE